MLAASNALPRVVLLILLASSPSFAVMKIASVSRQQQLPGKAPQKTGAVQGMVRDANGRPVGGATATLRNLATGEIRKATANAEGVFRLVDVPAGEYELSIAGAGDDPLGEGDGKIAAGDFGDRNGIDRPGIFRSEAEPRSSAGRAAQPRARDISSRRRSFSGRAEPLARDDAGMESLRHRRRASLRAREQVGSVRQKQLEGRRAGDRAADLFQFYGHQRHVLRRAAAAGAQWREHGAARNARILRQGRTDFSGSAFYFFVRPLSRRRGVSSGRLADPHHAGREHELPGGARAGHRGGERA